MSPDYIVNFHNVSKQFGDLHAVQDLSLAIPRGCIYGFIGPNGAGKTTAMRILVGITNPSSGSIKVLDSDDIRMVRKQIGYLPEEKGLYKRMRLVDYIVYFGRLNGMNKLEARKNAIRLLEEFQLGEWQRERCQALSKGMGQKVQLITTLVHEPTLMVLDEPFSGLDPVNVEVVRRTILEKVKQNSTVILSTHIMEQAEQLCDELVLINQGHAILKGPIDEVCKGNSLSIEHTQDLSVFKDLDPILSVKQIGRVAILQVEEGCDSQALLRQILDRTKVTKFNASSASLHEVFLREVGETAKQSESAND